MTTQQKRRYALLAGGGLAVVAFVLVRGRSGGGDELLPVLEDPFGDAGEDEELSLFDLLDARLGMIEDRLAESGEDGVAPVEPAAAEQPAPPPPVPVVRLPNWREIAGLPPLGGTTTMGPFGQTPPAVPGNAVIAHTPLAAPPPTRTTPIVVPRPPTPTPAPSPSPGGGGGRVVYS